MHMTPDKAMHIDKSRLTDINLSSNSYKEAMCVSSSHVLYLSSFASMQWKWNNGIVIFLIIDFDVCSGHFWRSTKNTLEMLGN